MSALPRFDWFQSDDVVTLNILKRGVALENCRVSFSAGIMKVNVNDDVIFEGSLAGSVKQDAIVVKCTSTKVEVSLPKGSPQRWSTLTSSAPPPPASVSFASKNWDAIEKAAVADEEKEELEGDAAVNRMFRQIYEGAGDDVKKAMMKSYQESGGTVLLTNWEDIKKKKTEVKPPDCMEYKQFEQ